VAKHRASRRPTISIVGPGNLGTALAVTLSAAGYKVESIAMRRGSRGASRARALTRRLGARLFIVGSETITGDIVWITVADDAIADVARIIAKSGDWKGKIVFHSSGALTSDELAPLRAKGARVASVHPMMTFVRGKTPDMSDVAFAIEGDASAARVANSIVAKIGGKGFAIRKKNKALYHVFGSFASPLLIALLAAMEDVALAAGIEKKDIRSDALPLLRRIWGNYLVHGAGVAFTGPLMRGDAATVEKHLAALRKLKPHSHVYTALATSALQNLPVKNRKQLSRTIARAR